MKIDISLMTEDDIDEVLNISDLSLKESWSRDSFFNELSNPVAKYLMAKVNDKVVGFAGIWTVLDEGQITNIAVHPDFRNIKIGSALVEGLISNLDDWKLNSMTLEVRKSNTPAQNLYKKYGFKEEGLRKRYYSDNKEEASQQIPLLPCIQQSG